MVHNPTDHCISCSSPKVVHVIDDVPEVPLHNYVSPQVYRDRYPSYEICEIYCGNCGLMYHDTSILT